MPKGTKLRNLRIDDSLWLPVKAKTEAEGTTISEVVRRKFEEYLTEPPPQDNPQQ